MLADGCWYWLGIEMKSDWHAKDTPSNRAADSDKHCQNCECVVRYSSAPSDATCELQPTDVTKMKLGLRFLDHPHVPKAPL